MTVDEKVQRKVRQVNEAWAVNSHTNTSPWKVAKDANLGFGKFSGSYFSLVDLLTSFLFLGGAWPSGQRLGLAMWWSRVRARFSHFPGFFLGHSELKSSATLVNSQLIASFQLGFLILLCALSTINKPLTFFFFALLLIFCWGSIPNHGLFL